MQIVVFSLHKHFVILTAHVNAAVLFDIEYLKVQVISFFHAKFGTTSYIIYWKDFRILSQVYLSTMA